MSHVKFCKNLLVHNSKKKWTHTDYKFIFK